MWKLFKTINNIFIQIILILFYFTVIGFAGLIHLFSKKNDKYPNSYWEKPKLKTLDITSSY